MKKLKVKIKYNDGIDELKCIEQGDLVDLQLEDSVEMAKGEYKLLSLGVAMELPKGYMAMVFSRSSTPAKHGIMIANGVGIIDESYCGNNDIWKFPAYAIRDTAIKKGTRIAQFMIVPKPEKPVFETVDHLTGTNRGGIGSTGE